MLLHNITKLPKKTHTTEKKIKISLYLAMFFLFFNTHVHDVYGEDDDEFFANIPAQQQSVTQDLFEKSNKAVFKFNSQLYKRIHIPIGRLYNKIPIEVTWTFKNFTQNYTETPKDVVLSVLDLDIEGVLMSTWRFVLNSFFGIAGLFDVAYNIDILSYHKTFEDVLHFYHIPTGEFIVLPFFGATTITELFASIFDFFILSPWMWFFVFPQTSLIFTAHNFLNPLMFINYNTSSLIYVALGMNVGNYLYKIGQDASYMVTKFENTINPYTAIKDDYLKQKKQQFAKYDKIRFEGQTNRDNICDYDGYILLPEECEEDTKEYSFQLK